MDGLQTAVAEGGPSLILALVALVGVALSAIFAGLAGFRTRVPLLAWFLAPLALVTAATGLAFFDLESAGRAVAAGDPGACLAAATTAAGRAVSTLGLAMGLGQVLLFHQALTASIGLALARGEGDRHFAAPIGTAIVGAICGGGAAIMGALLDARWALGAGVGVLAGTLALAVAGATTPRADDATGWRFEAELRTTAVSSLLGAALLGLLGLRAAVDISIFQSMADPATAVFAPRGGWALEGLPVLGATLAAPLALWPGLRPLSRSRAASTVGLALALGGAAFMLVGVPLLWANASVDRCLAP